LAAKAYAKPTLIWLASVNNFKTENHGAGRSSRTATDPAVAMAVKKLQGIYLHGNIFWLKDGASKTASPNFVVMASRETAAGYSRPQQLRAQRL
jgi:hypothetical protein